MSSGGQMAGSSQRNQCTIIGLFDDVVDARTALQQLQSAKYDPDDVSLLVRDHDADKGGPSNRHLAVAQCLAAMSLDSLGRWLAGVASVIVPERGTFLVAGPLGAALTDPASDDAPGPAESLVSVLHEFGFQGDEAVYVEHRLTFGKPLVAVTVPTPDACQAAQEILTKNNAVHVGIAQTDPEVADEADELLDNPPPIEQRDRVYITDVTAPLRVVRKSDNSATREVDTSMLGSTVIDEHGRESGTIEAILVDDHKTTDGDYTSATVRYAVIGFGGVLGLGRHFVAVPVDQLALDTDPVRVSVSHDVLKRGPLYEEDVPFSRREEQVVCAYFGAEPYWETAK